VADVVKLFWRALTDADFFNIERGPAAAPQTGGGQTYVSISFRGITSEELGRFLEVDPPERIETERPTVPLTDVGVAVDPTVRAPLEFAPRYQLPQPDGRYRISRQNRQTQNRHPAWTAAYGFPEAPDDVIRQDPRLPDLTYLKVYVARLDNGDYLAGFFNSDVRPPALQGVPGVDPLFQPFDGQRSAGMIEFEPGALTHGALAAATREASGSALSAEKAPEVLEAVDAAKISAGKPPSGQGRRQDAAERRAIELRGMQVAIQHLTQEGWNVEDVSLFRPYDLHCRRAGVPDLRVEVKGTTGDGSSVLLTPGEVEHARAQFPNVSLMVVSGIQIDHDEDGAPLGDGGTLVVVNPWEIDAQGELRPTGFEYKFD
jgi:hypothetical protein